MPRSRPPQAGGGGGTDPGVGGPAQQEAERGGAGASGSTRQQGQVSGALFHVSYCIDTSVRIYQTKL